MELRFRGEHQHGKNDMSALPTADPHAGLYLACTCVLSALPKDLRGQLPVARTRYPDLDFPKCIESAESCCRNSARGRSAAATSHQPASTASTIPACANKASGVCEPASATYPTGSVEAHHRAGITLPVQSVQGRDPTDDWCEPHHDRLSSVHEAYFALRRSLFVPNMPDPPGSSAREPGPDHSLPGLHGPGRGSA